MRPIVRIVAKGDHSKTNAWLVKLKQINFRHVLEKYGQQGVSALASATPVRTGATASAWSYEIKQSGDSITLTWVNSNRVNGVNIAVILQYGHGTGTGGYVAGRDYINPAIRPIFDSIAQEAWKEVTKL